MSGFHDLASDTFPSKSTDRKHSYSYVHHLTLTSYPDIHGGRVKGLYHESHPNARGLHKTPVPWLREGLVMLAFKLDVTFSL